MEKESRTPIVKELVDYISKYPDLEAAFEESLEKAREVELDLWTQEDFKVVKTLNDYWDYMDKFVNWVPTENREGTDVYNHLCFFYFILDLLPLRDYQSPIHPSSREPWTWLSEWIIRYAKEMGLWMDCTRSFDPEQIKKFTDNQAYRDKNVDDFYKQYPRPLGGWKTFNEFFARRINAECRPIADPKESTVIVCPADCRFDDEYTWAIHDKSKVEFRDVKAKGVPWSIRQLLDDDSGDLHSDKFCGGIFTHAFLNTTNYHRIHAPVSGTVVEAKVIPGLCYLEVGVEEKPGPANPRGPLRKQLTMRRQMRLPKETVFLQGGDDKDAALQAPNSPGYQFLQARALILIESDIGLVAVLPIGMAQVSSVVLSVKKGGAIEKGQEVAFFQLGGSDVVMVFQKDANVQLNPKNSDGEVFTKVGSKIGTATLIPSLQG